MAMLMKLILLVILSTAVFFAVEIHNLLKDTSPPVLNNTWWGPDNQTVGDAVIYPFKINISEEILNDLQDRLKKPKRYTPPLAGTQQQYGFNTDLLKEIVEFWKTEYDWRAREAFLNKYPQFQTNIQGLDIHYVHVKPVVSKGVRVLPLLLLHGWPGSVRDFYEVIELLTTPQSGREFVFEVVVPSIPGFGFSQGATKPGLGPSQVAVIFNNLMKRLGLGRYYLHGGDVSAVISNSMAVLFEENVIGLHSTLCYSFSNRGLLIYLLGAIYPPLVVEKQYEDRMYPLTDLFHYLGNEVGYATIHANKPDTMGLLLGDSPLGLAAHILEKVTSGTNYQFQERLDGGLKLKYKYEDLLDNVMIYWVTNSATTSTRLYSEYFTIKEFKLQIERCPVKVPTACTILEHEIIHFPHIVLRDKYQNIVYNAHYDDVGHFISLEAPTLLANDLYAAFGVIDNLNH